MNQEQIQHLLDRYRSGQCSEKELYELHTWFNRQADNPSALSPGETEAAEEELWHRISQETLRNRPARVLRLKTILAVAASVTAVLLMVFFFSAGRFSPAGKPSYARHVQADIAPGGNRASIVFGNGTEVPLDSAKDGLSIVKEKIQYDDGTAFAQARLADSSPEASIVTPRGGTYHIVLSDGTKVWLNAASALSFPTDLSNGPERKVTLKGEAYFEVSKDQRPFIVATDKQEIKVLGTHFNISAYPDEEEQRTTLLEGSVRVMAKGLPGQQSVLQPGQQSVLKGNTLSVGEIDTEEAVAWKNGYFLFRNEPLEGIMRKISRWYDVDIEYQRKTAHMNLEGTLSRFSNVSVVLRLMELTGNVHFKIEGRRIIVMQ